MKTRSVSFEVELVAWESFPESWKGWVWLLDTACDWELVTCPRDGVGLLVSCDMSGMLAGTGKMPKTVNPSVSQSEGSDCRVSYGHPGQIASRHCFDHATWACSAKGAPVWMIETRERRKRPFLFSSLSEVQDKQIRVVARSAKLEAMREGPGRYPR